MFRAEVIQQLVAEIGILAIPALHQRPELGIDVHRGPRLPYLLREGEIDGLRRREEVFGWGGAGGRGERAVARPAEVVDPNVAPTEEEADDDKDGGESEHDAGDSR